MKSYLPPKPGPFTVFLAFTVLVVPTILTDPAWAAQPPAEPPTLPASDIEKAPWVLGQGEQRILHVHGLDKFSLGSPCVRARAVPSRRAGAEEAALLIKGTCPGIGDIWIRKKDGTSEHRRIRVEKLSRGDLPLPLERALGQLEEAEVLLSGDGAVLRGEIRGLSETARIRALAEGFPKQVVDETEPSEELLAAGRKAVERWLASTPSAAGLKLERQGRTLFVRGSLERPSLVVAAERQIRARYPQAVVELDAMPDTAPTVYFRVFLLELKKTRFRTFGLSWPALQEGAFRVTTAAIQDSLALDVALQALEGDGSLRVLSNPELVVRAPGEAELFAGGEIPILARSHRSSNVTWKNFGLTLHLKVTHSSGERVRLDVFTEVSHLDNSIGLDQIPGIQSNRMKTQVDARYGVPLLLSGLLQQGMREQARGLPLLRQIPVLGKLFGSDDYLNERSELVAILLPASAPPSSPMERITKRFGARGHAPLPRQWVSPSEERALRQSAEWPWNALQ